MEKLILVLLKSVETHYLEKLEYFYQECWLLEYDFFYESNLIHLDHLSISQMVISSKKIIFVIKKKGEYVSFKIHSGLYNLKYAFESSNKFYIVQYETYFKMQHVINCITHNRFKLFIPKYTQKQKF